MRKEDQDQSQRKQPIWLVMDSAMERNKHEPNLPVQKESYERLTLKIWYMIYFSSNSCFVCSIDKSILIYSYTMHESLW